MIVNGLGQKGGKLLKKVGCFVSHFLLPPRCYSCGEFTTDHHQLCASCWSQLHFIGSPSCQICGTPMPYIPLSQEGLGNRGQLWCAPCLVQPPSFDLGISALVYKDLIRKLIVRFKHGDATYLAPPFAQILYQRSQDVLAECDFLIPVPMHRWRLLRRRYNQTTLLARYLSKLSHVPVLPLVLLRSKNTSMQKAKNRKERQENVAGAFRLSGVGLEKLRGKTVCLVDDVWTTGATLSACTRVLQEGGVHKVIVLTVARVVAE